MEMEATVLCVSEKMIRMQHECDPSDGDYPEQENPYTGGPIDPNPCKPDFPSFD